jgi:hypothetical protein
MDYDRLLLHAALFMYRRWLHATEQKSVPRRLGWIMYCAALRIVTKYMSEDRWCDMDKQKQRIQRMLCQCTKEDIRHVNWLKYEYYMLLWNDFGVIKSLEKAYARLLRQRAFSYQHRDGTTTRTAMVVNSENMSNLRREGEVCSKAR